MISFLSNIPIFRRFYISYALAAAIPMMNDEEIKIIEELLTPTMSCFEWGCGGSTLYFPKYVKSWLSYEHDPEYYAKVKKRLPANVELKLVPLEDYTKIEGFYDFILIDGQKRKECLVEAHKHIKPEGVILLHDGMRIEYMDWMHDFPSKLLNQGEIPDLREVDPYEEGYTLHRGLRRYLV